MSVNWRVFIFFELVKISLLFTDLKPDPGFEGWEESCPAGTDALCACGTQSRENKGSDFPTQLFLHPDLPLQEAFFYLLVAHIREQTVDIIVLLKCFSCQSLKKYKSLKSFECFECNQKFTVSCPNIKFLFQGRSAISPM